MNLHIPNNVFIGPVLREASQNGISYERVGTRTYSFEYPANPKKVETLQKIYGLNKVD